MQETIDCLINANKDALHQFFETMCPLEVVDCAVQINENPGKPNNSFETVGVISISGACKGSVSVHISKILAEKVAKNLLGMDIIEDDSVIYDTVGEVANIVVGGAKTMASSRGLEFEISCPTVIRGNPFAVMEPAKGSDFAFCNYTIDGEPFLIMMYVLP